MTETLDIPNYGWNKPVCIHCDGSGFLEVNMGPGYAARLVKCSGKVHRDMEKVRLAREEDNAVENAN